MATPGRVFLCARALWELLRYDLIFACRGLSGVRQQLQQNSPSPGESVDDSESETAICEAVRTVAPLYWKPVRCLQRSIVSARLMRQRGILAEVVVGYRAAPFFSHAWVEVAGRVANDSPSYRMRLQILERF